MICRTRADGGPTGSKKRAIVIAAAAASAVGALLVLGAGPTTGPAAAPSSTQPATGPSTQPVATLTPNDVIAHLNDTIDWYRRVRYLEPTSASTEEFVFRDTARKYAREGLHQGFDFARAEADILATCDKPAATTGASASSKKLSDALARNVQRITDLNARLESLDRDLKAATANDAPPPPTLVARRDKVQAELNLVTTQRDVIQNLSTYVNNAEGGHPGGLRDQIAGLEKSVPDEPPAAAPAAGADAKAAAAEADAVTFRPQSAGILTLVSEMFATSRRMSELQDLVAQTTRLNEANDKLRQPIRNILKEATARGQAIGAAPPSDDPARLAADKRELDAITTRYKQVALAAVPLRQESAALEGAATNLGEWRAALDRVYGTALHYLLVRLGGLAATIVVVLGLSVVWKRATFRYVTDLRRRRQFLVLRRVVAGSVVTLVVVASFVTEFGSIATYAGLLTAGIAVALQSVILSGVAYFFFVGRYGVRVGDRVTISGVTGDVIDIGLFRLYLMELTGSDRDLRPTGRVVVFSNAILWQAAPFFKQIPGAEYVWHQMALTLAPDTDVATAEAQLMGAVNAVFGEYRERIEAQYELVQQSTNTPLPAPKPEGWLRFVDTGLEFVVRYPVEIHRAPEIDDRITRKLLETIEVEHNLKLVATGTPKLQPRPNTPAVAGRAA